MLNREEIEQVKKMYPKDTPIRLYEMEGERTVPPGMRGTVKYVDDVGQIHVAWENGERIALNPTEDQFTIITPEEELSEKKEKEFLERIDEILQEVDFKQLNLSCNIRDVSYAAEKLFQMHKAFEEVYGEGYVNEGYGLVTMPAVIRGRKTGLQALALVTIDLESSGEHWGTTFFSPRGPLIQGHSQLTQEEKQMIHQYYVPYDYWYTPLVEQDHHVDFTSMPEIVADIRRMVDGCLVAGEGQEMEGQT